MRSIRKSVASKLGAAAWASAGLIVALLAVPRAWAQAGFVEQPHDWQIGTLEGATPVFDAVNHFHNELLIIITLITLFVMALLGYVMVKFNAKRHPVASVTTHNTLLEVAWTVLPVIILFAIWVPSIRLLYYEDRTQHADMTLKVTGHQWYWSYEYPDNGDFAFDSNVLSEADDAKADKPRLLGVDNPVVVPVGAVVRVLITGTDVIHSWYLPAAAVQEYAVVGRVNESWFQFERTGTFFGQCNQICGVNHPFMPIEVDVVSKDDFAKWAAQAKQKFAKAGTPAVAGDVRLAAVQ
ncbi:MAG TPA: cytochrome c oxidase subunit II [Stellaceae bacterium]|jgi:cytochrome c oxidase subunit 2|nr:cytochrome c oxidase subunit II [Stellaceae bacterium]